MKKWIEEFFQKSNQWDLDKILGTGYPEKLQALLQIMLSPLLAEKLPAVLPRIDADKKLWFYIVGKDNQQLTELRGIVTAYLGGTYIVLDQIEHHSSNDLLEKMLLDQFQSGFLRLHIHKSLNEDKGRVFWVIATLNQLIQQYTERPVSLSIVKRPTGRILRDFFIASNHHDYESAVVYYEELKNRQLLSKRNLISLEIQALAAGNRWKSLLDHPDLPDFLIGRTPRKVLFLILRALRVTALKPDNLLHCDIDEVRGKFAHLDALFFRIPDLSRSSDLEDEWKCWSIGAAAFGYSRVLEVMPEFIDAGWKESLEGWASLSSIPEQNLPVVPPIELLLQQDPSVDTAALLLKESVTASEELGAQIYRRIGGYSQAIQTELFESKVLLRFWELLSHIYGEQEKVSSWPELFICIINDPEFKDAVQVANEYSDYWDAETWDEQGLTNLVNSSINDNSIFRDVLPILLSWLNGKCIALSAGCIEQLLLNLATDSYFSTQDLVLCGDLTGLLVDVPHTKSQYGTTIDAIESCWDKVKSAASVDDGLEIIDLLIDAPCADRESREGLWYILQEFLIKSWSRLDNQQKLLSIQFSLELTGTSDQFIEYSPEVNDVVADGAIDLEGKKLAIYTLTEGAGKRAKKVLETCFPGLNIFLNHDKKATSALIALAERADFFVFSSRSAAHQAFYPVTERRSDLIYPAGKGSTSIIRAFIQRVENN